MADNKELFKQLLTMQRRNMGAGNRKKSRNSKAQQQWMFPFSLERKYAKQLTKFMRSITLPATQQIFDQLDTWISEYDLLLGRVDELKTDAYPDDLKNMVSGLRDKFAGKEVDEEQRMFLSTIGFGVSDQSKKQFGKFTKKLLGLEFITDEPWETETIKAWGETNYGLIKGLGDEYVKRINTVVSEGVQHGRTAASIKKEIRKINKDINVNRAKLIARDQVGKLHSSLTKRRQEDAGIDWYIWSTVGDERVRGHPKGSPRAVPNHFIMNDLLFKWNDNTVYSDDRGKTWKKRTAKMSKTQPGMDIQCRCSALPYFADIMEDVDKQIEKEKKVA